jgi:hypothetical protein
VSELNAERRSVQRSPWLTGSRRAPVEEEALHAHHLNDPARRIAAMADLGNGLSLERRSFRSGKHADLAAR